MKSKTLKKTTIVFLSTLLTIILLLNLSFIGAQASESLDDEEKSGPYFDPVISSSSKRIWLSGSKHMPKRAGVNVSFKATGESVESISQDSVFLVDWSESMDLPDADPGYMRVAAANQYIEDMSTEDRGALVKFAVNGTLIQPLTSFKSSLKNALNVDYKVGAGTNFEKAISTATEELIRNGDPKKQWVEVLLTDGIPTHGGNVTRDTMEKVWNNSISIYTIGLGESIDHSLLHWMARTTGGEYYHVSEAEELMDVYLSIFNKSHSDLTGKDITVRMDFYNYINVDLSSFSFPPTEVEYHGSTVSVRWDIKRTLKIGDRWGVRFFATTSKGGWSPIFMEDSGIYYTKPWNNDNNYTSFPNYYLYGIVQASAPAPPPAPGSTAPPPQPTLHPLGFHTILPIFLGLGLMETIQIRSGVSEKSSVKMESGGVYKKREKTNLGYTWNER